MTSSTPKIMVQVITRLLCFLRRARNEIMIPVGGQVPGTIYFSPQLEPARRALFVLKQNKNVEVVSAIYSV